MDTTASLNQALAGRYEIEREIGQGGMAMVYLARDVRHNRRVALKVLHPDLAAALGAERFLAEITTTANLQHPHILPLHDSGDADGHLFYVMPYVEGETLRGRLQREQLLAVDDAVRLAREVLSALDYAHRHGVVHRDIKPENILLHDGSALVADFGISLAVSAASGPRMTQTGLSLGTPSYMSPEQAMGDRVIDGRADIYATGATLYEMLIGEPPFTGPTSQAVVARLLTEEPRSLIAQRKTIPPNIDAVVRKALQKLPADRFATAADMSSAIARAEFTIESATARVQATGLTPSRARHVATPISIAVAAGVVGALIGAKVLAPTPVVDPPGRFSFETAGIITGLGNVAELAISPDGSRIVYSAADSAGAWVLRLRSLDDEATSVIPGTKMATRPMFSPDGRQLVFVQDGSLRSVPLAGGPVKTIAQNSATGASAWITDDALVLFGRTTRRLSLSGAIDTIGRDSTHGTIVSAALLPGSKIAILAEGLGQGTADLFRYSIPDQKLTPLGISGLHPTFVDGGYLVYVDVAGELVSVRIDNQGRLIGKPTRITNGIRLVTGRPVVAVSRSGTVVFQRGTNGAANDELVTVDRSGHATRLPVPANEYRSPRYSPDGRRLAMTISRGDGTNNGDVWTYDFASQRLLRLSFDGSAISPSWMPDGRTITFTHRVPSSPGTIYKVAADASTAPVLYFEPKEAAAAYEATFTSDGKTIIFRVDHTASKGFRDVYVAATDSPQVTRPLLTSPFQEHMIALAPDNKWLAYVSDASGRPEVYLKRIDAAGTVGPVSRNGGTEPRWAGSMRELLFRKGDSLFSVPLELGAEPRLGQPKLLFTAKYAAGPWDTLWDVSPDGKQFAFVLEAPMQSTDRLTVLTHWIGRAR